MTLLIAHINHIRHGNLRWEKYEFKQEIDPLLLENLFVKLKMYT